MKFTSFLAVGITALLIGAGVSYYTISNQTNAKMTDKAFLEKQLKSLSSGDKKDTTRRLPIVRVAPAQMSDISDEQIFDGRLVEIQKVVLASEVSGLINEMTVEVGDKVQAKKTLIVGVDATWLNIALIQAQRQKEFDRVNMTLQKAELNRLERLRERQAGVVTDSELEKQTALAEESVAKYKLSEAMENEIQEKLNRTKIYAPFNGAIIRKLAELGAYVSPGTPLVEIVSDGQADALFHINEKFIQRIHIGDPLPIYVPAVDKTVNGEIVSIVPYGSTAARCRVAKAGRKHRLGRSKRVRRRVSRYAGSRLHSRQSKRRSCRSTRDRSRRKSSRTRRADDYRRRRTTHAGSGS